MLLPCRSAAREPLRFSWAVLTDTPAGVQALDFTTPPVLPGGATFQVHIGQQPGAFIYLYLLDSSGGLYFLFPKTTDYYATHPPAEETFRIPEADKRFELVPPPGEEKIYLLASSSRLTELENLTAAYLLDRTNPERRAAVLQELKSIRRRHSRLAQTTEISVPVAGTIRTRGEKDDSFDAFEVETVDFYSRTLRINHE
jgi:hypothetical protein